MLYSAIFVDMFNLAYRRNTPIATHIDTANAVITYINGEILPYLDGNLYLLFDPLPKSDMGMSKNFRYNAERKKILSCYKKGRVYNPIVYNALLFLRKYYTFRGEKIKTVISYKYEADDYVEDLLRIETGTVAMVTNDSDWMRYINDRVVMIPESFSHPYTKESYFQEYGVVPTIASITLAKCVFGDSSDNVHSIFGKDSLSKYTAKQCINEIARMGLSFEDVKKEIRKISYQDFYSKFRKEKTPLVRLMELIKPNDAIMDLFMRNLRVVECRCKDVTECIKTYPEDKEINTLLDTSLGRISSAPKKFVFTPMKVNKGRVKK